MPDLYVPVSISHFPKLKDDFVNIDVSKQTVGRCQGDLYYNRNADWMFMSLDHKAGMQRTWRDVPAKKCIGCFYMWDYSLEKFKKVEAYYAVLDYIKSFGVDKVVAMDFSIWLDQPDAVTFYHMYLNFIRTRQAQDKGFSIVFNENLLYPPYRKLYEACLPDTIPCVMVDANHADSKESVETKVTSLKMLLDICTVNSYVIQTSTKTVGMLAPLLSALKTNGVNYRIIPSQTALLSNIVRRQKNAKKQVVTDEKTAQFKPKRLSDIISAGS